MKASRKRTLLERDQQRSKQEGVFARFKYVP